MFGTMLFLGILCLLLGEETFRFACKKWKIFMKEISPAAPKHLLDLRFQKRLYRRRIQIAASLLILGGLFPAAGYFVGQKMLEESSFCLLMSLLLLGWVCVLALADGIASYIHFSRRSAEEIIEEEKKFLREHLPRRNFTKRTGEKQDE